VYKSGYRLLHLYGDEAIETELEADGVIVA
jgi:hypothetical protein